MKANNASPTFTGNVTCTNGLTVSGTSSFDSNVVEIVAPPNIKCLQTAIDNGVIIGGSMPVEAIGIYVSNNGIINRNLTVNNNLTVAGNINCGDIKDSIDHVWGSMLQQTEQ